MKPDMVTRSIHDSSFGYYCIYIHNKGKNDETGETYMEKTTFPKLDNLKLCSPESGMEFTVDVGSGEERIILLRKEINVNSHVSF